MRISLRFLFVLTAAIALVCLWLTTRRSLQFPSALVQFATVSSQPINTLQPTDDEIVDEYYRLLLANLRDRDLPLIERSADPAAAIRELIRFEHYSGSGDSANLMSLSAWDNSILGNREELKEIFAVALETLTEVQLDGRQLRILYWPSL